MSEQAVLTDEQVETVLRNLGRVSYMPQVFAVIEDRAAQRERERIVAALRTKFGVTNRAADYIARGADR